MCMKTVIVPLDFTGVSINAAWYAAEMALALNARLYLFHAAKNEKDKETASLKTERLVSEIAQYTVEKISLRYKTVTGFMEDELLNVCSMLKPLAVVMATHGENRKGNLFFDSATVFFSRNLEYPVINVPGNAKFQPIRKILLATDGEMPDTVAVKKVVDIVKTFNAAVDIVHIYQNETALKKKQPLIEAWKQQLKGVHSIVYYIRHNNIYDAITGFAKAHASHLLLTFPGRHSIFHKSESKKLLFNAPVAMMTIQ